MRSVYESLLRKLSVSDNRETGEMIAHMSADENGNGVVGAYNRKGKAVCRYKESGLPGTANVDREWCNMENADKLFCINRSNPSKRGHGGSVRRPRGDRR